MFNYQSLFPPIIIYVVSLGNGYKELHGGPGETNHGLPEPPRPVCPERLGLGGGGQGSGGQWKGGWSSEVILKSKQ